MQSFKAAFINEVERMVKRKKVVVVLIVSILSIVIGQLLIWGFRTGFGIRAANSSEFPLVLLPVFAGFILPLFTTLVAIDTFGEEYSANTMKIALLRPVTRFKLFSAKVSAIGFFVFLNLFIVMILSSISGLLFNAFYVTFLSVFNVVLSYILTLIPMMVLALFIVLLCHFIKSGTGIFFLSVGLFIVSHILVAMFPQYATLFITYNLNWYNLFTTGNYPIGKIVRLLALMSGSGLMLFTTGYYLFEKKSH